MMDISEKKQAIKQVVDTDNLQVIELLYDVMKLYEDSTLQDNLVKEAEDDIYNKRHKSVQEMRNLLDSWDGQ